MPEIIPNNGDCCYHRMLLLSSGIIIDARVIADAGVIVAIRGYY